jgi:hypothetical protein
VKLDKAFFPGLRFSLRTAANWAADAPAVFQEDVQSVGGTILPSSIAAPLVAAGSLGLEGRLVKFPFGSLSALASWQLVRADGGPAGSVLAYGPTGGLRLYVAKVAVPALDLGAAYNLRTGLYQVAVGVGMRM